MHAIAEWPLRAKDQQISRKCSMVDYAIHKRRFLTQTPRWYVRLCIRTCSYLGWSVWAPEPVRLGRFLRAVDSSMPNFGASFLHQFSGHADVLERIPPTTNTKYEDMKSISASDCLAPRSGPDTAFYRRICLS